MFGISHKKLDSNLISVHVYILGFLIIFTVIKYLTYYGENFIKKILLLFHAVPKIYMFLCIFIFQEFLFLLLLYFSFMFIFTKSEKLYLEIINYYKSQFKWCGWIKFWQYVIGGFFVYLFLMILIGYLLNIFNAQIPGMNGEQKVGKIVFKFSENNFFDYFVLYLAITVVGPLIEEMIFRGFITARLLVAVPKFIAIIYSSLIFTAFHMEGGVFWNIFILGLILTMIYTSTDSLIYSFLFHFIINFIAFGFLAMIN